MYRARVFVRFQDDPVATVQRVSAGWQLTINEASTVSTSSSIVRPLARTMIFGASAGLVAWLVRAHSGP